MCDELVPSLSISQDLSPQWEQSQSQSLSPVMSLSLPTNFRKRHHSETYQEIPSRKQVLSNPTNHIWESVDEPLLDLRYVLEADDEPLSEHQSKSKSQEYLHDETDEETELDNDDIRWVHIRNTLHEFEIKPQKNTVAHNDLMHALETLCDKIDEHMCKK
jgi:hypothetical protein